MARKQSSPKRNLHQDGRQPAARAADRVRSIAAELLGTRDRFRRLIENISGYVIFTMDEAGTITSWNRGMERMLGYAEAEVIGRPFEFIFTVEDQELGEPAREISEATRTGEIIEDRWHMRKDGSRFWTNGMLFALHDPAGGLIGLSKVMRDLSTDADEGLSERAAQLSAELATTVGLWQTETAARERLEFALLNAVDEERQRLGQELHDGISQHLAGTAILAGLMTRRIAKGENVTAEETERIAILLNEAVVQVRALARGLRPVLIDRGGLNAALRELADRTALVLPCRLDCTASVEFPDNHALHLYRIAQEAINNALTHAAASKITIKLHSDDGNVVLQITDDGKGMRTHNSVGMGMRNMEDRAKVLGGSLTVESKAEKGTIVKCSVPFTTGKTISRQ